MKKLLGITIFLAVVVAIAGTISDLEFLSDKFMNETVKMATETDGKRHIASGYQEEEASLKMWFPVSEDNIRKINGKWSVKKYTHEFGEGEKMDLAVRLELVANGMVTMIVALEGSELDLTFSMKEFEEGSKLVIINELGYGKETLDLVREVEKVEELEEVVAENNEDSFDDDNIDLVVVSAQNPTKEKVARVSSEISGSIIVIDGQIEVLDVSIEGESISLEDEIDLKTAGIFNTTFDGQHVSARYTKINDNSVKVRFFSGPLAGNIVLFGTEDERENKIEESIDRAEQSEERVSRFDGQQFYKRENSQVRVVASTESEMEGEAEQSGFDFTQNYE